MDRAFQSAVQEGVEEMARACPWMDEDDRVLARDVVAAQFGMMVGEVVDVDSMAGALFGLAQRAEAVGDRLRAWGFDQWYRWACASMRGEEYHWPALPAELTGLV